MFRCPECGGMSSVPATATPTDEAPNLVHWKPPQEPPPEPAPPPEPKGPTPWGVKTVVRYIIFAAVGSIFIYLILSLVYWAALTLIEPDISYTYHDISSERFHGLGVLYKILNWAFLTWLVYYIVKVRYRNNFREALKINKLSVVAIIKYGMLPSSLLIIVAIVGALISLQSFEHLYPVSLSMKQLLIKLLPVLIGTTFTALVAPIPEEIMFRGFIFTGLKNEINVIWAAIITSILFFLIHLPFNNPFHAIMIGLLALALIFARIKTDSTTAPIVIHFSYNFYTVVANWMSVLFFR